MKQVKTFLMAITLLIGIGIPQLVKAQAKTRIVTPEDIALLETLGFDTNKKILGSSRGGGPRNRGDLKSINDFVGKEYPIDVLIEQIKKEQNAQQNEGDQLPINLVGKWNNKNDDKHFYEFHADNTMITKLSKGMELTVKGTDISYPLKARIWHDTWKKEGNLLIITPSEIEYVLGDISYYPADIQIKIKDDLKSRNNDYHNSEIEQYVISSFSPEAMTLKQGEHVWAYVRDVSGMSAQEKNEFNKEKEKWNQINKEKEKKELQVALERDNLKMAKLKAKAIASGDQYDYWIIGHAYEFGEGNDGLKITICLDSALVWYKKAAAIDSQNERYVTAVSHKIKTGGDYYEDKAKANVANAKKDASKLGSKYGATLVNNLINTGQIKVGTPLALLQELIPIVNRTMRSPLQLEYYEPTMRDMQQYGRTAKRVKIVCGGIEIYSLMIANSKVVAVYRQGVWLKIE